ncbi:hypothetical protein OROMI_010458 [Orobanche minor]
MAADGVKESLTVYEMATEHLRKAREVLDRLESASSMASDANDTTEVVSNNIARSLFLCNYIKCGPEPERAQWNGNVERMEHEAGMLQERLDTYMVGQRQIEQGVYLLVGAMNSTGKQKEQVMKKQSDTSVAVQSLSKSSEKKRKKRYSEQLSCRIRVFKEMIEELRLHPG